MYAAASFNVVRALPFGGTIGLSKERDQGNQYLFKKSGASSDAKARNSLKHTIASGLKKLGVNHFNNLIDNLDKITQG